MPSGTLPEAGFLQAIRISRRRRFLCRIFRQSCDRYNTVLVTVDETSNRKGGVTDLHRNLHSNLVTKPLRLSCARN